MIDQQVRSACWALEKGISVVICNGMAENAVRNIIAGRKMGTFFTDSKNGGISVESAAEQGNNGRMTPTFFPSRRQWSGCFGTLP